MSYAIVAPEMYLEIARAFARCKVGIEKQKPDLKSVHDLPIATQANLQFAMTSLSIIYGVSYLEARINGLLEDVLAERVKFTQFNLPKAEKRDKVHANILAFQKKYADADKRDKLFKREPLTKKIKLIYRIFDQILPFESKNVFERKLWEQLIELQNLRNELIHLKPQFIGSKQFVQMMQMEGKEREEFVMVPVLITILLSKDLPLTSVNESENVLVSEAILMYQDNQFLENLMLGHPLSDEAKRKYLSRQPHKNK